MEIEPIRVDALREPQGFVILLRGTDGRDVRLVFKQWFWLDRIIWLLLKCASAPAPAGATVTPIKVAVLPPAAEEETAEPLRKVAYVA